MILVPSCHFFRLILKLVFSQMLKNLVMILKRFSAVSAFLIFLLNLLYNLNLSFSSRKSLVLVIISSVALQRMTLAYLIPMDCLQRQ